MNTVAIDIVKNPAPVKAREQWRLTMFGLPQQIKPIVLFFVTRKSAIDKAKALEAEIRNSFQNVEKTVLSY